jgi:hypothetical protein
VTDHLGIEAIDAIRGKITPNQMNAAIPERRPATEEISGCFATFGDFRFQRADLDSALFGNPNGS